MKLEWFRKHKTFVYWILLPVVGIGMAFFGVSNLFKPGAASHSSGPSVRYTVAGKTYFMDPMQVYAQRQIMARFLSRNDVSSDYAARHEVKYHIALADGFDFGPEEMAEKLVEQVKEQVQNIERGGEKVRATEEVYDKLLAQRSLTRTQFEEMTRELGLIERLEYFISGLNAPDKVVNDPEMFIAYLQDNEVVRLRYQEVASADFLNKAQAPLPEAIKTFYDNHYQDLKNLSGSLKDILVAKPKMSAEILFYDPAPLFKNLKPTEDELNKFYKEHKSLWKETPPAGTPPPAPGKETYKDYNTVKADVEKQWLKERQLALPKEKLDKLKDELDKAEKAYAEEEAQKPAAERKPFGLAAWAEKNGLKYWLTGDLTEDEFRKGKKEVGASNAEWVADLFSLTQPFTFPHQPGTDPRKQKQYEQIEKQINEGNKKRLKEFSEPKEVDPSAPEKGFVLVRKKTFVDETIKPYPDVQTALGAYLRVQDAVELAGKEAKRLHDEWNVGNHLPALDSLKEISDNSKNQSDHPLIEKFFEAPKAVGEVLDVAQGPAKPEKLGETSAHQLFYVGFAVERQLPTWKTFHNDTAWDRNGEERRKLARGDIRTVLFAFEVQAKSSAVFPGGGKDQPLFEGYHGNVPVNDDY